MAIHQNQESMQREALQEMFEVAELCVNFDKSKDQRWKGANGCYGYPGALILFSIVDSLGSIIEGGGDDVSKHFKILNNPDWYALNLTQQELEVLEKNYRNKLSHNAHIPEGVIMRIGSSSDQIMSWDDQRQIFILFLVPFLERTRVVVQKFLAS